jgi:hypothetical protein
MAQAGFKVFSDQAGLEYSFNSIRDCQLLAAHSLSPQMAACGR